MKIGVPTEIKNHEYRVGLIPSYVKELTKLGHTVIVQKDAAEGIGFSEHDYRQAGAETRATAAEVYAEADMIVKVKEPQPVECAMLRPNQLLFAYLHLAPDPELAHLLQKSGCTAIAYETVTNDRGGLPLLAPMSEVAGRMSIQAGSHCLEKAQKGRGILLCGVPGVPPAKVVVLGGGVGGTAALRMAVGAGAEVCVIDNSLLRLSQLDTQFGARISTIYATADAIQFHVSQADLVVGAVLVPGASAPKLVTRSMLTTMKPGSVIVDMSIDQGGCCESSRPTTHAEPTYIEQEVVHYCVTNMPGGVPRTATYALNNATLPFIIALAQQGFPQALRLNPHLLNGLNVHKGQITHPAVAEAIKSPFITPLEVL